MSNALAVTNNIAVPDFRSPKTGLYSNLARLNLPHAEAVFDISYFKDHPEPFYVLAKELYPGKFHPTISHAFLALLAKKRMLQMLFTQNIDCLERAAGVPADKIVEAHGSFATQRCIECKTEFPDDEMREHVNEGKVPRCKELSCNGLVKPDIVFFGEALPAAFREKGFNVPMADLALVIGTSLSVYPFAGLPDMVRDGIPRVLFNMERVGRMGTKPDDVLSLGPCDEGIRLLAKELGWADELDKLWRGIVGDEEAEKQNTRQRKGNEEVEDELQKLTDDVQAVLNIDDDASSTTSLHGDEDQDTTRSLNEAEAGQPHDALQDSERPDAKTEAQSGSPSHAKGSRETGGAKKGQDADDDLNTTKL